MIGREERGKEKSPQYNHNCRSVSMKHLTGLTEPYSLKLPLALGTVFWKHVSY